MFFINHTEIGEKDAALLEIEGPLNSETGTDFEEYVIKILESGIRYIIIDAERLEFISSEGIGVTLLVQRLTAEKNGFLAIFGLSAEIENLYRLLGFDRIFTIAPDRREAMLILDRQMEMRITREKGETPETVLTGAEELDSGFSGSTASASPSPDEAEGPSSGFSPFIIKCLKCDSPVKINEPGKHICPHCGTGFNVTGPKQAEFDLSETSH